LIFGEMISKILITKEEFNYHSDRPNKLNNLNEKNMYKNILKIDKPIKDIKIKSNTHTKKFDPVINEEYKFTISDKQEREIVTPPYYTVSDSNHVFYPQLLLILAKDHSLDANIDKLRFKIYIYNFDEDEQSGNPHKIIKDNIIKLLLQNPYFVTIFKQFEHTVFEEMIKNEEVI